MTGVLGSACCVPRQLRPLHKPLLRDRDNTSPNFPDASMTDRLRIFT